MKKSSMEVGAWVRGLNFGTMTEEYAGAFTALGVEGEDLPFVDDTMLLDEVGMTAKIHRLKMLRKIEELLQCQ